MEIDKKIVGQRIKSIRQQLGFNMEEFGKLINNTSKGAVNNWEKGINLPNNERLSIIARMSNMSVDELLYGGLPGRVQNVLNSLMFNEIKNDALSNYKILYDLDYKIEIEKKAAKQIREIETKTKTKYTDKDIERLLKNLIKIEFKKRQYLPYTSENAVQLAHDQLWNKTIYAVDEYFKLDNIENNNNSLEPSMIKESLSYNLYEQIRIILEDASDKLKELK